MTEQRRAACAVCLSPRSASSARLIEVAAPSICHWPRLVRGGLRRFLVLRRSAREATVYSMQRSPMRATRPNVAFVAKPCVLQRKVAARPSSLPAWARPNPSLHLTFASRLRRLSPAGELKR